MYFDVDFFNLKEESHTDNKTRGKYKTTIVRLVLYPLVFWSTNNTPSSVNTENLPFPKLKFSDVDISEFREWTRCGWQ